LEHPLTTRRDFLTAIATLAATAAFPHRLFAQADKLAADPNRPQFHLLPAHNWMNDPNGPIYYNGRYHMFFQYNPLAATWGDMSWYHSTSPDMLHWQHLPIAFTPTPNSPDAFGCFSGSALQVGKRVYQVYTGTKLGAKENATILGDPLNIQESQCLAYSDDPQLIRWTKLPEPIIPLPPPGMAITGFRDPSAWKHGDHYYMTVGAGEVNVGGCVLLYKSTDLHHWEYLHKLTSSSWNGHKTPNPCDDGEMWECPDFFPLDGQHLLIFSTLGKVFWQAGTLDPVAMTFTPKKTGELDLGAFYAPKTQLDAHGRRILWGWIQEKRSPDGKLNDDAMRAAGWSGMMSLPRVLSLDHDGTLRITALPEAASLRLPYKTHAATLTTGSPHSVTQIVPKACGELLCTADSDLPFTLMLTGGSLSLQVAYDPAKATIAVDGKTIPVLPGDAPHLHAFIDGSVLELLINQRIGYTKRFYNEGPAPDITGTLEHHPDAHARLQTWTLKPISPNRLTT
jgi:beta-fructofuranosidase